MVITDWVMLGVLVLSFVLGLWRGLTFEVLSLLAWGVAFFAAQWGAAWIADLLPLGKASAALRHAAGFVVVFIACLLLGSLVAVLGRKLMQAVGLSPVDRLLGGAFGLARGVLLLLVVAVVVHLTSLRHQDWWQASVVAGVLTVALQGLKPVIPAEFGSYLP